MLALRLGCALLLLAASPVHAVAALPAAATNVSTAAELLAALQDASVSHILLTGEVHLSDAPAAALPIRLDARNLTISGPVPLDISAASQQQQAAGQGGGSGAATAPAAHLDFSNLWPVLEVSSGSRLTVQDLIVSGMPPLSVAARAQYAQPATMTFVPLGGWGAALYPSVVLEDGSEVHLERSLLVRDDDQCTPERFASGFANLQSLLGNATRLLSPDTAAVYGNHTIPLLLKLSNGQDAGQASLHLEEAAALSCSTGKELVPAGTGAAGSGGGGGLPAGAWVGLALGAVTVATAAALSAGLIFTARRRRRQATAAAATRSSGTSASKAEDGAAAGAVASVDVLRRQQCSASIGSLLRVRFGGLEGLEIGGLIGRGAWGKVYRGSLRGVTVAIKVIEHSVVVPSPDGSPPSAADPTTEALLLTSLAHPNIVSVYKTAVLKVQAAGGLPSSGSSGWAAGNVSPGRPVSPVSGAAVSPVSPFGAGSPFRSASRGADGRTSRSAAGSPPSGQGAELLAAEDQPDTPGGSDEAIAAINLAALEAGQAAAISSAGVGSAVGSRRSPNDSAESMGGTSAQRASGGLATAEPEQYETWIVMQFCERGSLEQAIHRRLLWRPDGSRRKALLMSILVDVAEGLAYLHESNVIHGDLKPGNVLLKSVGKGRMRALIVDFGLSKLLPCGQQSLVRTQTLGTAPYMAPELLSAGRMSRATDIYSMGMMIVETFTDGPLFPGQSMAAIFYSVVHEERRPALPPDMPPALASLVHDCWQQQPEARPPVVQVLAQLRRVEAELAAAAQQCSRAR